MANGETVTRSVGFGIVQVGEHFTVDEAERLWVSSPQGELRMIVVRVN